jgi:hypothetical protein
VQADFVKLKMLACRSPPSHSGCIIGGSRTAAERFARTTLAT